MVSLKKMVLGAAVALGAVAVGAAPAQAAEFGFYARGPVVSVGYVPPCPGDGYVWVAPYRVGGFWYPGRWNFVGVRRGFYGDRIVRERGFDRHFSGHERFRR